ncbi:MAG: sugar transferase [Mastigocoleus sp. MO_167.B18]|nr:sugar transferase [Mastigocoleus sp. MO_167.B18]
MIFVGDILGIFIYLGVIFYLHVEQNFQSFTPFLCYFLPWLFITFYIADLYIFKNNFDNLISLKKITITYLVIISSAAFFIFLSNIDDINSLLERQIILLNLSLLTTWALILRWIVVKWVRLQAQNSRWLILGIDENAIEFSQKFTRLNPYGKLAFITDSEKNDSNLLKSQSEYLGELKDLPLVERQNWSGIIVTNYASLSQLSLEQLLKMRLQGGRIHQLLDFYENLFDKIPSSLLDNNELLFRQGFEILAGGVNLTVKRIADVILSIFLLLTLSPFMFLVAIAIKLDSQGGIFYSQVRTGLHGKTFKVYKFRSMYQDAEKQGVKWAEERDSRITNVGHWIRLFRIDELPQVWNVIRGEMSLIGPRPERPEFDLKLKQVIPYYELRYSVKPGITGWAQVMYPYGASIKDAAEKLSYDLYYIKNYSWWLEIKIFVKTIQVILLGKGR